MFEPRHTLFCKKAHAPDHRRRPYASPRSFTGDVRTPAPPELSSQDTGDRFRVRVARAAT